LADAYLDAVQLHQLADSPAGQVASFLAGVVMPLTSQVAQLEGKEAWSTAYAIVGYQDQGRYHPVLNGVVPDKRATEEWLYENRWRIAGDTILAFVSMLPGGEGAGALAGAEGKAGGVVLRTSEPVATRVLQKGGSRALVEMTAVETFAEGAGVGQRIVRWTQKVELAGGSLTEMAGRGIPAADTTGRLAAMTEGGAVASSTADGTLAAGSRRSYLVTNDAAGAASIAPELRFSTDEIVGTMRQSEIGRTVVDAAHRNEIDLLIRPYDIQPQVRGYALMPNQSGRAVPAAYVFVENNAVIDASGVVDRPASLLRVGEAGVHEGLHALGVEGSWEAELWARRLMFEHLNGRPPSVPEIMQMEWDMSDAGPVYDALPARVGRQLQVGRRVIRY
jgi:hypothetical protein